MFLCSLVSVLLAENQIDLQILPNGNTQLNCLPANPVVCCLCYEVEGVQKQDADGHLCADRFLIILDLIVVEKASINFD